MTKAVKKTGTKPRVGDGTPGPGRPKGTTNKTTALLKEAIIAAAEAEGENGKGKDGLTGYCRLLAREERKAFTGLLGRVLPMQVALGGQNGDDLRIEVVIIDPRHTD